MLTIYLAASKILVRVQTEKVEKLRRRVSVDWLIAIDAALLWRSLNALTTLKEKLS